MTKSNKKPLIIWDFDGVIADSEKLWTKVWCDILKEEKGIVLSSEEKQTLLVGVGAEGNNTPQYRKQCQDLGVVGVCATIPELHQTLKNLYPRQTDNLSWKRMTTVQT